MMQRLLPLLSDQAIPARNTFDLVLAVTLEAHGVERLYTRNTGDFSSLHMFEVRDPLAE